MWSQLPNKISEKCNLWSSCSENHFSSVDIKACKTSQCMNLTIFVHLWILCLRLWFSRKWHVINPVNQVIILYHQSYLDESSSVFRFLSVLYFPHFHSVFTVCLNNLCFLIFYIKIAIWIGIVLYLKIYFTHALSFNYNCSWRRKGIWIWWYDVDNERVSSI